MNLMRPVFFSAVLMAIYSAGCSGGGGGGSPAPTAQGQTLDLLVDSSVGDGVTLSAVLDGAVLERTDGTTTGNLLAASQPVTLAHPLGAPATVDLADAPPGTYAAVHLLFRTGSGAVRGGDGVQRPVDLNNPVQRLEIEDGPASLGSGRHLWQVRHRTPPPAGIGTNGGPWNLDLSCSSGRSTGWDSVRVQVATVAQASATVDVTWNGAGGPVPMTLTFDENSILQDRSRAIVELAVFLGGLQAGIVLEVDGIVSPDYTVLVRRAKVEDSVSGGSGGENKILGRITARDLALTTLDVQVLEVVRGTAIAAGGVLPQVVVDGSAAAIRRSSSSWTSLPFEALGVGDFVEVEWAGALQGGNRILASEIELEDPHSGSGVSQTEVEGQVGSIDVGAGTVRMVPRGDDPVVFEGRSWPAVTVQIDGATLLYLDHWRDPITLGEVVVGQRIWVKGAEAVPGAAGPGGEPVIRGYRVRVRN